MIFELLITCMELIGLLRCVKNEDDKARCVTDEVTERVTLWMMRASEWVPAY